MEEINNLKRELDLAQEKLGLFNHVMSRSRPYNGQPWTNQGIRGAQEIKGITFRDLTDAFFRAYILSTDHTSNVNRSMITEAEKGTEAVLSPSDLFEVEGTIDIIAVSQNLCCEIEKLMGIYPNTSLPGIPTTSDIIDSLTTSKETVTVPFVNNEPVP